MADLKQARVICVISKRKFKARALRLNFMKLNCRHLTELRNPGAMNSTLLLDTALSVLGMLRNVKVSPCCAGPFLFWGADEAT